MPLAPTAHASTFDRPDAAATGWRLRWQRWWLQRLPRSDQTTLTHRNLYILPTRPGWMLALTLVLLLVASINYQLNLGHLLTFLIAGSAAVGMHVTHRNLRGLALSLHPTEAVFAGQPAPVDITLHNPSRRHRHGVGLRWIDDPPTLDALTWVDVAPQSSVTVRLARPTQRRGRLDLPPILVETRFPLGTFRVWHWWRPASELWVYPAPETPAPPLPVGRHADDGPAAPAPSPRSSDEVDGVRPYRRGDPLKWVAWKKVARYPDDDDSQWVSRDFSHPPTAELWLDAGQCGLHDEEGRRSRLCAWVLQAQAQGMDYGLRLNGTQIPPSNGAMHRRRCLEALACE